MQTQQTGVGAVLLAAGAGRRMGHRPKALLRRDGEPLLLRQIRLLAEAGVVHIAVVLGHHVASLEPLLAQVLLRPGAPRLVWCVNPDPDTGGQGSSLRLGLRALPAGLATLLVLPVDQPLLERGDISAVLEAWRTRALSTQLVVPQYVGQSGHPVAFGPRLRAQALQGDGVEGLSAWRRAHPEQVEVLEVEHARCSTDVDTPEDVERVGRAFGVWLV